MSQPQSTASAIVAVFDAMTFDTFDCLRRELLALWIAGGIEHTCQWGPFTD